MHIFCNMCNIKMNEISVRSGRTAMCFPDVRVFRSEFTQTITVSFTNLLKIMSRVTAYAFSKGRALCSQKTASKTVKKAGGARQAR